MSNMINFGIDLGTTNSLIAKFNKGAVGVFKNPRAQGEEILPSVVAFRPDRILFGKQAKTYAEKDPRNVRARFKRKMGTTESFRVPALGRSVTPIELSAFVLKELKTFIHAGETPDATVITVPASFDMVQSNATKEAGHAAGFKQVVLLQEPIAASLAYANQEKNLDLRNSEWIVYDLGGGTFDVALVRIQEGELKVVDHEGDNYLGGSDFDALIVKQLIVPHLEKRGRFTDLVSQMTSDTGRYNTLWYGLMHRAEDAKIELSSRTSAEIDLGLSNIEDEDGNPIDGYVTITRSEFETLIKDAVDNTAEMLKKILTRNSLRPQDLKFILMVGGCTYIPFVRKRVEELLGIPVNTGIDPTNAIVLGAAYFAATREIDLGNCATKGPSKRGLLKVKVAYNRASQEREELFSAKVEGETRGLFYRITREDGAYDSGLKQLSGRINEDLPLQEDAYNSFVFRVYDDHNNPVATDAGPIQIAQGRYSVAGQMLPEDISLVKDDLDTGDTKLEPIFLRSCVLPAKGKTTVEATKLVAHGSDDEIRIIVVEGPSESHFTANKTVGLLTIAGKQLRRDILRGTEISLKFELSESRDLTVCAYVEPSGPEFSEIFKPTFREVPVGLLTEQVQMLSARVAQEEEDALASEKYEIVERLKNLRDPIQELEAEAMLLASDDTTDDRYKLEARKRKIAQELHLVTAGKELERLRKEYASVKSHALETIGESGNDLERRQLNEIIAQEHSFVNTTKPQRLQERIEALHRIVFPILRRTPAFLEGWFQYFVGRREVFNDQVQAKNLIEAGRRHIAAEDWDRLAEVNMRLYSLLPEEERDSKEMQRFTTGIG
jgi:molecular chaperone DnaK